jgi:ATP-dependent Clp protease adapter protein ClpS
MDTYEFYTARRVPRVDLGSNGDDQDSTDDEGLYEVRIIDNDHNTYQQVMDVTMLALGIDQEQAFLVAWEVDHLGSCVVAHGPQEPADALANLIRTIGIEVQVNPVNHRTN